MKLVPAILAKDTEQYRQTLAQARRLTDRFHIDIIDGKYVENMTVQPRDIQKQIDNKMDMHLMVEDPVWYAQQCVKLNPHIVIVQLESPGDIRKSLEFVVKNGFRSGLSLNPSSSVEDIKPYIDIISHVQVMGYEAGFAGQKLNRQVLKLPEEIRKLKHGIEVGIDGGVNINTISAIVKADFDVINVNSFIFNHQELDPLSAYSALLEKIL
ncbi:MAG: ribulose-phosphate 3-epimerase [Patescibacteria group bacterium]|jgi:ribulose-phosphate 3-epimerase|nr:ribulose-phosphate 3-epimerase [Patescibacteria group bacterium]